ncbi:MAG: isoprenylcysteine carboxylmethyltransferase family protein [bacterium]|nr:isoprenylcysteine carboxylmethyltransferase family protein [bacterium]
MFIFNIIALIIFAALRIYWFTEEHKSETLKPRTTKRTIFTYLGSLPVLFTALLMLLQLLGLHIFPYSEDPGFQFIGFSMIIVGCSMMYVARQELSSNWTHMYDYQIKQNHTLITTGIYKFVRHPIYSGLLISFIGCELLVQSWLIILAWFAFIFIYVSSKREEKLLQFHFGKKYEEYIKSTKMFIPYIF